MKKLFVLMIALMVIAAPSFAFVLDAEDGSYNGFTQWGATWGGGYVYDISTVPNPVYAGDASYWLHTNSAGSFGAAYAFTSVPGAQYTVTGYWKGQGGADWIEVLMFNDDGRSVLEMSDAPVAGAIIAKHDGFGTYPPSTFDWEPITNALINPNTVTATGTTMYVVIKAGNGGGGVNAWFDNIAVNQVVTPEPSSLFALASGIGALGFGLRRRIR